MEDRLAPATFAVNSVLDKVDLTPGNGVVDTGTPGEITLRGAVMEANALAGGDTITLDPGYYLLTIPGRDEAAAATGDLDITGNLTLIGAGDGTSIIDAGALDRAFDVFATASFTAMTIRNGNAVGNDGFGGGIYGHSANITVSLTSVSENIAEQSGGGIYGSGTLTVVNSTLTGNRANDGGGVAVPAGSTAMITAVTFDSNTTVLDGAGIHNVGTVTVTNSTFSANRADRDGGGILNLTQGSTTVASSTLTQNIAGRTGGGVLFSSGTGGVSLKNTIVAQNMAAISDNDVSGLFVSNGNNLIGDRGGASGFTNGQNGDIVGTTASPVNAMLAPLADNGGPNYTHALLPGSPATDAGNNTGAPTTDQRGYPRPRDSNGDTNAVVEIGAVEMFRGMISGTLFFDKNEDGVDDANDPPLEGWTVFLDEDFDGVPDAGERSTVTDADGFYRFTGVEPSDATGRSYAVTEAQPDGWRYTLPATIDLNEWIGGNSGLGIPGTNPVPRAVTVGDFDQDGDLDIATAVDVSTSTTDRAVIFRNDGGGDFSPVTVSTRPLGQGASSITPVCCVGGLLYLAVTNSNSDTVTILRNSQTDPGDFGTLTSQTINVGDNPIAVAAWNFGGGVDMIVANRGSMDLTLLTRGGNDTFTVAPGSPLPLGGIPGGIGIGDLDSDGLPDLAVAREDLGDVLVLINDGNGGFRPSAMTTNDQLGPFPVGSAPKGIIVRDFNGDQIADLAVVNSGDDSVSVLLNFGGVGAGWFGLDRADYSVLDPGDDAGDPVQTPVAIVAGSFESQHDIDLDGDGDLDLVIANQVDNDITVLTNDGSGTFFAVDPIENYGTGNPTSLSTGDFDGDERPDLVANAPSNGTLLLKRNRTGTHDFWLGVGENATLDFGNAANPANIRGTVFHDVDADGLFNGAIDVGLTGWTIFVDLNNNGVRDAGDIFTDSNGGFYGFVDLDPTRTFTLIAEVPPGWRQTVPVSGMHVVTPGPGGLSIVDFGNANSPPTTAGIPDVYLLEDVPPQLIILADYFNDLEDSDSQLTFTLVGNSNPGLVSASVDPQTTNVNLVTAVNSSGRATLTVRVTDRLGEFVEAEFDVIVIPVEFIVSTDRTGFNPSSMLRIALFSPQRLLAPAKYSAGLDFDARGVLYGAGSTLQIVSPYSGETQVIGSLHNEAEPHLEVRGIAFAPDGTLYGISGDSRLFYRIDPQTAFTTVVGPIAEDVWGIDFGQNGVLYAAGTHLVTLDPMTGNTLSTIAQLDTRVADIQFGADALYAVAADSSALYKIDAATGTQTIVGNYASRFRGLAIQERGPTALDFAEPNDARLSAEDLGIVSADRLWRGLSIHQSGNQDWFRFQLASPGESGHEVGIEFSDSGGDLDLALFDAAGAFLTQSATSGESEGISLAGRPAGIYFARVVGFGGATNPDYALAIRAPGLPLADFIDMAGVGDSFANAHSLQSVEGPYVLSDLSIEAANDDDWFRFTTSFEGTANHSVGVEFPAIFGNLDLQLYDAAGNVINSSLGVTGRESISLNGLRTGTYYLRVFGVEGATSGAYRLNLETPDTGLPDFAEPNDNRMSPFALGVIEGRRLVEDLSIHQAGNADWYRFETVQTARDGHFVSIDFTHALGDLDLFLFNAAGDEVAHSSSVADREQITLSALPAGTYFVRVNGYLDATNARYNLTVQAPLGTVAPDRLEFNDVPAQPTELDLSKGDVSLGDLSIHTGDADVFRIQTTQPATASDFIIITFPRADGDLLIQLLDDDASHTVLRSASSGTGDFESLSLAGLAPGTYFVRISGDPNRYDLKVDASVAAGQVDDWTILVYMTASDLAGRAKNDIEELELAASRLGSTVNLAVYLDQSDAAEFRFATGGGTQAPWGDAGRGFIAPDFDITSVATIFDRIGEQNSGNPQTLKDFVNWAIGQRPAARYGLILWGHGSGVFGSNIDDHDPGAANRLQVPSLSNALGELLANNGIGFDLIGFDASLMSMSELAASVAPYTDVLVASAQVGESQGFDYDAALDVLRSNPDQVTAALLGSEIVQAYRRQYSGQSTLSAFNAASFNALQVALQTFTTATVSATIEDFNAIKAARDSSRAFVNPAFRDLGKVMETIAGDGTISNAIRTAAGQVNAALRSLVLAEATNPQSFSGMSIYFPDELLTSSPDVDYPLLFQDFNTATGWFDFLEDFTNSADGRAGGFESDKFEGASGNNIEALAHRFFGLAGTNVFDSLTIDKNSDVDWFSFTIAAAGVAGNQVRLTHDHQVDGAASVMELAVWEVDGDGVSNQLQVVNTVNGQATVSLQGRAAGEYRVRVRAPSAVARYNLNVTAPASTPASDWIDTDATNANATQAKAYRLAWAGDAREFTGLVLPDAGPATSFDWFTFTGPAIVSPAPTRLRITSPSNESFQVRLLDANAAVIDSATATGSITITSTFAANAQYFIEVSSNNAQNASFSLGLLPLVQATNATPPHVTAVRLRGTSWTGPDWFQIPTGADQLDPAPWSNVDQVQIQFDEEVVVQRDHLAVAATLGAYAFRSGVDGFQYDAQNFVATWTFTQPIASDKVLLTLSDAVVDLSGMALDGEWSGAGDTFPSGDGVSGGDFAFRINVLPGDTDANSRVDVVDTLLTRLRVGQQTGSPSYDPAYDIDKNDRIDVLDTLLVRLRVGQSLPPAEPALQGVAAATIERSSTISAPPKETATVQSSRRQKPVWRRNQPSELPGTSFFDWNHPT